MFETIPITVHIDRQIIVPRELFDNLYKISRTVSAAEAIVMLGEEKATKNLPEIFSDVVLTPETTERLIQMYGDGSVAKLYISGNEIKAYDSAMKLERIIL